MYFLDLIAPTELGRYTTATYLLVAGLLIGLAIIVGLIIVARKKNKKNESAKIENKEEISNENNN